jgi:hypothetical protein
MNLKRLTCSWGVVAAFYLFGQAANAQDEQLLWVTQAGGTDNDFALEIALDSDGNSATTGYFRGTATFGNTPPLTSAGDFDIFVAKYDQMSNALWAKKLGGSGGDFGKGIAMDNDGNIIVAGHFRSPAVTFGSATLTNASATGTSDIFIVKLNSDGDVIWALRAGSTDHDEAESVTTDGDDNIIVTGSFKGTVAFGSLSPVASAGIEDIFVAKCDPSGNFQWVRKAGGTAFDRGFDVATDFSDNIFITGDFNSTPATFESKMVSSAGGSDIFVAKYTPAGTLRWVKSAGGTSDDRGVAIETNNFSNEDPIVTGMFSGAATFAPGKTVTSAGGTDIFIAEYFQNPFNNQFDDGHLIGVKQAGGTATDFVGDLAIGAANYFVIGSFQSAITFGATTLQSVGNDDIFLAKFDSGLDPVWAVRAGGTLTDQGIGIAADVNEDLRVSGYFQGTATFDAPIPPAPLTSRGAADIFVARYGVPPPDDCRSPNRVPDSVVVKAVSPNQIDVTWRDRSNDEQEFIILRIPNPQGTNDFVEIDRVGPDVTAYSDKTVEPDVSYSYRIDVQCAVGVGEGGIGSASTIIPPDQCAVTGVTANSISLSWFDNSAIEHGYVIERRTGLTGDYVLVDTLKNPPGTEPNKGEKPYTDNKGLAPGITYDYRIYAYRGGSRSLDCDPYPQATTLLLPPISPILSNSQLFAGEEFSVDIKVGSTEAPVSNLRVVSFELQYTNTAIVDYVSHEIGSFMPGAQATVVPDDANGKVSASIFQINSSSSGQGVVLRLQLKPSSNAAEGQTVTFSFAGVQANDATGALMALSPTTSSIAVTASLLVWPGDADNNGIANIFDINSIVAIHWTRTGAPRPGASIEWLAQPSPLWNPREATYANCDGNGIVNIFDINAVVINFGKTHTGASGLLAIPTNGLSIKPLSNEKIHADPPLWTLGAREVDKNQEYWVEIQVGSNSDPVTNLKIVSFELTYTNTAIIDYVSHEVGSFLTGAMTTVIPDDANGKISASVFRTTGSNTGSGIVLKLKFMVLPSAAYGQTVAFDFAAVQANREDGTVQTLAPRGHTITIMQSSGVESDGAIPGKFALSQNYPNPINPETRIQYDLPRPSQVQIDIINLHGQIVRRLVNEHKPAGAYTVVWDGRMDNGEPAVSGVYLYRLKTPEIEISKKLTLIK